MEFRFVNKPPMWVLTHLIAIYFLMHGGNSRSVCISDLYWYPCWKRSARKLTTPFILPEMSLSLHQPSHFLNTSHVAQEFNMQMRLRGSQLGAGSHHCWLAPALRVFKLQAPLQTADTTTLNILTIQNGIKLIFGTTYLGSWYTSHSLPSYFVYLFPMHVVFPNC